MPYKNKICYPKDSEFLVEALSPFMPEMICQYFCHRAYGHENATPIENPTGAKSGTLLGWKQNISFFMINLLPAWDEIHHNGNPTKSAVINDLIATVTVKKETRGKRKKSCADRSFKTSEFVQVLMSLRNSFFQTLTVSIDTLSSLDPLQVL